jgi:hypothetical protein
VEPQVKQRYPTARLALTALQEYPPAWPPPAPVRPAIQHISVQHPLPSRYHRSALPPSYSKIQVNSSLSHLSIRIPNNVWAVALGWGCIETVLLFLRPTLSSLLSLELLDSNIFGSYVWLLVGTIMVLTISIVVYLTGKGLTNTTLEIDNLQCCLNHYLLGQRYRQIRFPKSALLYVAPQWRIIRKSNSGILDWLLWLASDKNEDNSVKVNVTLFTTNRNYILAPRDIKPTEANWLIDVIEDWLNASRIGR